MPSTSSLIAVGWSPFGSYSDLMTKRTPPSDFSGRGGRCGVQILHLAVLALEFGAAVADQAFQRVRGGGDAERLHLVARRPRHRGEVFLLGGEAELLCQFRIERRDGGGGAVIGRREFALRGFAEAFCSPPSATRRGREASGARFEVGGGGSRGIRRRSGSADRPPTPDPSPPRASRAGEGRKKQHRASPHRRSVPRVEARARCSAASPPERRSFELSGGGCSPVPEPMPASPRLIAGLSSSASAGPIGCTSGRCAFDFGVLPGFLGVSGFFAMGRIWDESGRHKRAKSPCGNAHQWSSQDIDIGCRSQCRHAALSAGGSTVKRRGVLTGTILETWRPRESPMAVSCSRLQNLSTMPPSYPPETPEETHVAAEINPLAGKTVEPSMLVECAAAGDGLFRRQARPVGAGAAGGVRHLGASRLRAQSTPSTRRISSRSARRSAIIASAAASTGRCSSASTPMRWPSRRWRARSRCSPPTASR